MGIILQESEFWFISKVVPGFDHATVDCYRIISTKQLMVPNCSDGKTRYSSIEWDNILQRGIRLMENDDHLPRKSLLA